MRFLILSTLATLALAQSSTTISSTTSAISCAAGQSTCNGVCYDSSSYVCCPAGLCASGSYCGQDSSGNAACCAANTAGSCSAASAATSLSTGATLVSGTGSATGQTMISATLASTTGTGSASTSASSGSAAASSSASAAATSSSSGAAVGHAENFISQAITYLAGGLVALL